MDRQGQGGRRFLVELLVTVVVSSVTAALVVLALMPGEVERPVPGRSAVRPGESRPEAAPETSREIAAVREESRRAVEELREAIAVAGDPELRVAVRNQERYAAELIGRLGEVHTEQHLMVEDTIRTLALIGERAVPGILDRLRAGEFPDASRGFGSHGSRIQGGSERMRLLDALRQIGTPAAKNGILSVIRESGRMSDYRDLFALYNGTTDEAMVEEITKILPGFLEMLADTGIGRAEEQASSLMTYFGFWLSRHGAPGCENVLARIVEAGSRAGEYRLDGLFGALVRESPEKAVEVVASIVARDPQSRSFYKLARGLATARTRAESVRLVDLLLAKTDLPVNLRLSLYSGIPTDASRDLDTKEEQMADLRAVRDFLTRRLAVETEAGVKQELQRRLDRIDQSLKKLEDDG